MSRIARLIAAGVLGGGRPDYFVTKSGNDTTGDGTEGAPWLTITKALATVPLAGGKTVGIGAGTYAEDTSGLGYLRVTPVFVSDVVFQSLSGNPADVILGGSASANFNVLIDSAASHIHFKNVTFLSWAATNLSALRMSRCSYITYTNCTFTADCSTGGRVACLLTPSSGVQLIEHITFNNCTFNQTGLNTGISLRANTFNTIDDIRLINCRATTLRGTDFVAVTNLLVSGGTYSSTVGVALGIGDDADSATLNVTATVTGATIVSTSSHAFLLGAGVSSAVVTGVDVTGGDYGLVIKECTGVSVSGSTIQGGTTAVVYFKAAAGCSVTDCTILNSIGGDGVYMLGSATSGNKSEDTTLTSNVITVTAGGNLLNWGDATQDAGGGVCDYNTYSVSGGGNFGSVRADTSVADLTELIAAWTGYDVADNDTHSTSV